MKFINRLCCIVATLFVSFNVDAEQVWIEDICYNLIEENNTAEIVLGSLAQGEVVIPPIVIFEEVEYRVTGIGKNAFSSGGLTSVIIPEGVISIKEYAFSGCISLMNVTFPKGGTNVGGYAFANCRNLTSLTFPEGDTNVGGYAFSGCNGLTTITIPENSNLTTVGRNSFYGCSNLEFLTMNCENIGDWFSQITTIKEVILGEKVTTIGNDAFYRCSGLVSVIIPDNSNLTNIESGAFEYCSSLTSISIPQKVTNIGSFAFYGCNGLEAIKLNCANVEGWFSGNETIKEVVLGENVVTIKNRAFSDCIGITSIIIPGGVTNIGNAIFYGCTNLISIDVAKSNTKYDSREDCNAIIETSSNTLVNGCSKTIVPESVTRIGNQAFSGCSGLTSIVIPKNVTNIGYSAFSSCNNLSSVVIPEGVTSLEMYLFSDCTSLTSITLPKGLRTVEYAALENCSNLKSITCYATNPPVCDTGSFIGVNTSIPIYVPFSSVGDYRIVEGWKEFANIIGIDTGVENIEGDIRINTLIYDINGVAMDCNFNELPKGVYIQNGKKFVVK